MNGGKADYIGWERHTNAGEDAGFIIRGEVGISHILPPPYQWNKAPPYPRVMQEASRRHQPDKRRREGRLYL